MPIAPVQPDQNQGIVRRSELSPGHQLSSDRLPVLGDVVVERHRLKPVLARAPATWTAIPKGIGALGILENLAGVLRPDPRKVIEELVGLAPPLKGIEGEVVLVVVPNVATEQRERHTLGIELGLHRPVLLPLRTHAAVTVTQCLLL